MYNVCTVHIHSPTIHFELEILVAFEDGVFHDLTHYVLQFTQPEVEILVPISRAFPHVEGLDVAIIGPACEDQGPGPWNRSPDYVALQLPSLALQQSICGTSIPQNNHCDVTVTTYVHCMYNVCTTCFSMYHVCTMYEHNMYNMNSVCTVYK